MILVPLVPLALAFTIVAGASLVLDAQADPAWLRMWNEAQTHRPEELDAEARIAPEGEPGPPLVIHGAVVEPDGRTPAAGVVVFAYQTDADGVYSGPGKPGRPWRLQGWVRTDDEGRFAFRTIRPAPYPSRTEPAHVHLFVETQRFGRQWTQELHFADDPLLSADDRRASEGAAPFQNVLAVRTTDGVQHVDFRVRLKPQGDF